MLPGVGKNWEKLFNVYGVSFWSDENVLELDGGSGCTNCRCTKCHLTVHFKCLILLCDLNLNNTHTPQDSFGVFFGFFFEIIIFTYQLDKYQEVLKGHVLGRIHRVGRWTSNFFGSLICQHLSKFKGQISHTSYSILKVVICRNKDLKQICQ